MDRTTRWIAGTLALLVTTVTTAATGTAPAGRLDGNVRPLAYRLELTVLPEEARFSGTAEIDIDIAAPRDTIYLHGAELAVRSATLTTADGTSHAANWTQLDPTGVASLGFAAPVPAGRATLRLAWDAPFGRPGEGLYKSVVGEDAYAFTQFQPIGARRVFPGFDEPGFKAPFDVAVTTRASHVVVGNAPVSHEGPAGEGLKRVQFATTLPLPTYLVALALGPLDVVEAPALAPNAVRDRPLPLRGVATRGKGPRLAFALANTGAIVAWLETYFGVAFPYPKLDLIASPDFGGGMENAGAIIYGDPQLLLAADASLEQLRYFGDIHAHELAHQWFGDLVTPKWWDDIWLNESFANWMGFKAGHAWRPELKLDVVPALQAPAAMDLDSRIAARRVRNPVARNAEIGNAFDVITYLKGGAVLGMVESWLGEDAFRAGIRRHMQRFPHAVADVEDFMASLAQGSGRADVIPAFRSFIDQPGVPLVEARLACGERGATLEVAQSRYLPVGSRGDSRQRWQLPLCVRHGDATRTQRQCQLLTAARTTLQLTTAGCPDFVMPNAGGTGYYRFALDAAGWQALMANFDRLSEVEALAAADSLSAAYQAGRIDTARFLAAITTVAASPHPQVALAPDGDLIRMRDKLAPADQRAAVTAYMHRLYRPRLETLAAPGALDDAAAVDQALFRTQLIRFLALEAGDAALLANLADSARRYLRMDDPSAGLDPGAVEPALVETALRAGVQTLGLPFVEALVARMVASTDILFRTRAAAALGNSDDPAVGTAVRKLLLDPRLRGREPTSIAFALADRPAQRRATFDWFAANHEAFLARISRFGYRWLPRFGAGFCSTEERDEVSALFTPLLPRLEGAERTLAETLEGIELCAALAEARRAEVGRFFAGN